MVWFIVGSLLFLVLHRVVEGYVVEGPNRRRRQYLWDMGTAGALGLCVVASLALVFISGAWRDAVGPVVMFGTPVAMFAIGGFAYLRYLVYTRDSDDSESLGAETR